MLFFQYASSRGRGYKKKKKDFEGHLDLMHKYMENVMLLSVATGGWPRIVCLIIIIKKNKTSNNSARNNRKAGRPHN